MKTNKFTGAIVFFLALAVIGLISFTAYGQTNAPAIVIPEASPTDWLTSLVTKWPWITTALMVIGVLRVIFKPLFTFLHEVVHATPTLADDELLAKVEESTALKWALIALDWLTSIKPLNPNAGK